VTDRIELDRLRGDKAALISALQAAGAHLDGGKVRCPFHDDAHASGAVSETGGTWAYTCFACDWADGKRSGDIIDVVRRARALDFPGALAALGFAGNGHGASGNRAAACDRAPGGAPGRGEATAGQERALPDVSALAAECAERLQSDAAALARLWSTRAVDAPTAEKFGVGINAAGTHWTFPVGGGLKHHRIDPDGDGSKCFWLPRGAESRRVFPVHLDGPGPVWLCPGELKALGVVAAGRSAVGITGGEGVDLPDELAEVLRGRSVVIVGDDDDMGRKWQRKALDFLAAAGIDARAVDLGLSKADGLKDVGDWLLSRVQDGKAPDEIGAELDDLYQRADPWAGFTLGGIWADGATWARTFHVPTGLTALDAGLNGGLRVGGAHLFVGKSGRAKTQTVTQLALNAARAGIPAGFVSLEMSRRDVGHLIAANLADVPRSWLGNGHLDGSAADRIRDTLQRWSHLPLVVVDDSFWSGALTRSGLVRVVGDGVKRWGWRLVVVDYLGLLGNEPDDKSDYSADLENSAALKRLARVQDVALVTVAALRKYGRKDDAPTSLDDVLGAGRLCYDAVNVFDLDCEQAEAAPGSRPVGLVRLRPLKTRYAALASTGRELQFRWGPSIGRISDLEAEPTFDADRDLTPAEHV
jgi:hypothetical protein